MGRCRIVRPEVVRLPLSDDDYLDVKKELNAGEYLDLLLAMADRQPFSKLLAYIVGWSLMDLNDTAVPFSLDLPMEQRRDTIRSLDTGTLRELTAAIDRHETAEETAREGKKKVRAGSPAPGVTLRSVS